jgi:hypothetical protein
MHETNPSKTCIVFSNSVTEMGQYKPNHEISYNPGKTLVATFPTDTLQQGGPLPSDARTSTQTEFHHLPCRPAGKRNTNFQLGILWCRAFLFSTRGRGKIIWYTGMMGLHGWGCGWRRGYRTKRSTVGAIWSNMAHQMYWLFCFGSVIRPVQFIAKVTFLQKLCCTLWGVMWPVYKIILHASLFFLVGRHFHCSLFITVA